MTIYVDELREYSDVKGQAARYGKRWCHMMTDGNLEELHAFAESIGMRRSWFQASPMLPHYDLVPSRREKALAAGATETTSKDMVRRCSALFQRT